MKHLDEACRIGNGNAGRVNVAQRNGSDRALPDTRQRLRRGAELLGGDGKNAMSFIKNAMSFATTSAFSTVGAFVGIGIFKDNKFARVHKACKQNVQLFIGRFLIYVESKSYFCKKS